MPDHDVLIAGGGLVGASLALALDQLGLRVLKLEAGAPWAVSAPRWDERHFALARRSLQILESLGVSLREVSEPIREVRVSRAGDFGRVAIRADDYALPALGATVPARALVAALESALTRSRVQRRHHTALVAVERREADVSLTLQPTTGATEQATASLLVGADGADSFVRTQAGIAAEHHDYEQVALVAALSLARPLEGVAHERFVDGGAVALLPLSEERAGLVWTLPAADAARWLEADERSFIAALEPLLARTAPGIRRVGARQPWPLRALRATRVIAARTVLVGNAAQTLHPIGAQGFNLGLRDVASLAAQIERAPGDPGAAALLEAHERERLVDRQRTLALTESMARLFAHRQPLVRALRGLALATVQRLPAVKRELAFAYMGYREPVAS